ncbi:MAG TPA: kelch repeat-containing protein [Chthoniobacterales bacterium]|nr:kelch repeat-containing protein [Chthoniobacterales bacterium]
MKTLPFLGDEFLPGRLALARRVAFPLLFLGAGLLLGEPSEGASDVFEETGSLAAARVQQTATLLPSGKVLVVGGYGRVGVRLGNAELYDPASGTWAATGGLAVVRANHAATLLPNGKVLVVGGIFDVSTELYDPATGTWAATGSLGAPRSNPTTTLLPNGKVLVAGGNFDDISIVELYDPLNGTWTLTGSLTAERFAHTATLLPNGKVLVVGGYVSGHSVASTELYDPATGTWAATGNLAAARAEHTATLLPNGKVLVAGGFAEGGAIADTELYDPASGGWTATDSLADARLGHTATLLSNGKLLVTGGAGTTATLTGAEQYDPVTEIWMTSGGLGGERYAHTATVLPNGKVLVGGGSDGSGAVASAELYLGQVTLPSLLNISTRMQVLTDDKVLIGGFIITGTELKRVLIRGIGPSLNGVGVTLPDPTLEVHQGGTTIATNDNWKMRPDGTSQQGDIEATSISPTNDLESAILMMLSPGAYTAILSGKDGGTGVGMVEVYDLGQGANSRPANVSTRGFVDTEDNVMIGGFIVGGGSGVRNARVIVRALGPSVPVAGALGNPTLELHDENGALIASNDNWRSDQQAEIIATGIPPSSDLESAIVRDFAPASYTAIVRGVNNTTGVALVEAYALN